MRRYKCVLFVFSLILAIVWIAGWEILRAWRLVLEAEHYTGVGDCMSSFLRRLLKPETLPKPWCTYSMLKLWITGTEELGSLVINLLFLVSAYKFVVVFFRKWLLSLVWWFHTRPQWVVLLELCHEISWMQNSCLIMHSRRVQMCVHLVLSQWNRRKKKKKGAVMCWWSLLAA